MTRDIKIMKAGQERRFVLDAFPDTCPICGYAIDARFKYGYQFDKDVRLIEALFQCPRLDCQHLFIGYFRATAVESGTSAKIFSLQRLEPKNFKGRIFSDEINSTSKNFVTIFNQAQQAETLGLSEIAGPGYRKALEFLVKDYAIIRYPETSNKIKQKFLASVINDHVSDAKIKSTAKRATWLGNDETHYYRKWEDKELRDMKILIDLTLHWIESEALTRKYEEDMTD